MNQEEHKKKAMEAARRADVAVLVINAEQPLRDSERPILKELLANHTHVVVAMNRWNNLVEEKDRKDLTYVKETLDEELPEMSPLIIPMNAQDSKDEGVQQLSSHFEHSMMTNKSGAQQHKVVSGKAAIARAIRQMMELLEKRRSLAKEAHQKVLQKLNNEIAETERKLNHQRELHQKTWR